MSESASYPWFGIRSLLFVGLYSAFAFWSIMLSFNFFYSFSALLYPAACLGCRFFLEPVYLLEVYLPNISCKTTAEAVLFLEFSWCLHWDVQYGQSNVLTQGSIRNR